MVVSAFVAAVIAVAVVVAVELAVAVEGFVVEVPAKVN